MTSEQLAISRALERNAIAEVQIGALSVAIERITQLEMRMIGSLARLDAVLSAIEARINPPSLRNAG